MKVKAIKAEKKAAEPRVAWVETTYSVGALKMMEQATGLKFTQMPAAVKAPVAATDDD